jgi:hypothetical protein
VVLFNTPILNTQLGLFYKIDFFYKFITYIFEEQAFCIIKESIQAASILNCIMSVNVDIEDFLQGNNKKKIIKIYCVKVLSTDQFLIQDGKTFSKLKVGNNLKVKS